MTDLDLMLTWLRHQIESDKAVAEKAPAGPWRADSDGCCVISGDRIVMSADMGYDDPKPLIRHVIWHDPRDVIADCDAKLAIIEMCERQQAKRYENVMEEDRADQLLSVLQMLTQGLRHRDGYDERWTA